MKRLAAALAALLLCLSAPAVAVAQLGPQNVPTPLTQDDSDPDTVNLDEDTGGFSTLQLVLTFGGAAAVVVLIAWFIMRDARGKAPAPERGRTSSSSSSAAASVAGGGPAKKSARERERERARKRNKAKAARNQRRRNRPR